jgi:hypothetical protein
LLYVTLTNHLFHLINMNAPNVQQRTWASYLQQASLLDECALLTLNIKPSVLWSDALTHLVEWSALCRQIIFTVILKPFVLWWLSNTRVLLPASLREKCTELKPHSFVVSPKPVTSSKFSKLRESHDGASTLQPRKDVQSQVVTKCKELLIYSI